jgi:hypothetical protein
MIATVLQAGDGLACSGGFALGGPEEAAAQHFKRRATGNEGRLVAQRIAINPAKASFARSSHGHIHGTIGALIPFHYAGAGCGEDVVGRVSVQVVLLCLDIEIGDAREEGIVRGDGDALFYAVATRVGDPVGNDDELPPRKASHMLPWQPVRPVPRATASDTLVAA